MPVVMFTDIYPDGAGSAAAGGGVAAVQQFNPDYPGMPVGATPVHRDVLITTATTTTLWTPPTGRKFVVASAFISTDAAMRVALVDDADVVGQRIVDGAFAASGGASPNKVPVPYPSRTTGAALKVVTGGAGNVRVQVDGWEVDA